MEQGTPSRPKEQGTLSPPFEYIQTVAPFQVIYGTAACGTMGALAGSTLGVMRNMPAIPAAAHTGTNTALFSFGFFGIREYLIQPLLLATDTLPTTSSPHTANFVPTALAGFSAGSLFVFFARGTKGLIKGGVTLGLGCLAVQSIVNELDVIRLTLALRNESFKSPSSSLPPSTSTAPVKEERKEGIFFQQGAATVSTSVPNELKRDAFSERSDRLIGKSWNWLKSWSPVNKIDEKEYKGTLEKRLGQVGDEIDGVEKELKGLDARLGKK